MAVSRYGGRVFVAIHDSGNKSTVLGGGAVTNIGFPPNVVSDPAGPYAGTNPPPNAGAAFDPPIAPLLPAPPRVSLIVKRDAAGKWMDDNGGDWTSVVSGPDAAFSGRPVGWTLLDHDVAIIDAVDLDVTYADGLLNLNMAIAVHPPTGDVMVVGTDATNEVRFEPNLSGTFVRAGIAGFNPGAPAGVAHVDLNPHLDYTSGTVPQVERDKSLGDPRGIAWNAAGTRAYITGMGTNNVVVLDYQGQRAGLAPTIEVGDGPTGVVLDEGRGQLYVLNKFASSLSIVSTATETETARVALYDPSPKAIRRGRRHLYDAHATSGTGVVSCASCHVDGRMDRLAWDLGDPSGEMKDVDSSQNLGMGVTGLDTGFEDWHPMKGPMLTQTLQDIIGKEPHHWRGDRDGLEEFSPAFVGLLGDDVVLSAADMQEFEDFLATISYPPNPFRNFDNSLPDALALPGHYTTGRFGPANQPLPVGNAVRGEQVYRQNRLDMNAISCVSCHTRPTGAGSDHTLQGFTFRPFPVGPRGEHHLAMVSNDGLTNVSMKVPHLRNLYERTGFSLTLPTSRAGFGYLHDGAIDSIERFVNEPVFTVTSDQQTADLVAFMLAFGGVSPSQGSTSAFALEPPGPPSLATHAAVGAQLTLAGPPTPAQDARLSSMLALADADHVGVVVKGRFGGLARGWVYVTGGLFQSDRQNEAHTRAALASACASGSELTFTVVPRIGERRMGIDRDCDGWYDRDEVDMGSNPAHPDRFRNKKLH